MMFRNILLASSAVAISALDTDNQGHGYGATAGKIAAGAVAAGLAAGKVLEKNTIFDWEPRVTSSFDSSSSTASSAASASDSSGVNIQCFGSVKEKCHKEDFVPTDGFAVCSDEVCQVNIFNYYFFLYLKNKIYASYWIFFVHDSGLCKFLGCCTCDSTVQVTKAKNKKKKPDTPLLPGHDKYPAKQNVDFATMKVKGPYGPTAQVFDGKHAHPQVIHPSDEQTAHHSFMQVNATLAEQVEEAGMEMALVDANGEPIEDEHEKEEHGKCHGGHFLFYCQNICCSGCKRIDDDLLRAGEGEKALLPDPHGFYPQIKVDKHSFLEGSKDEDHEDHHDFHKIKKCPDWAPHGKTSKENCYADGCCAFDKGPCDLVPCFKRCVKSDKKEH